MDSGRMKRRKLKDPGTLRVFFSSPFGGMEEEREELTRKYFPQFHHACNARGIQFVPVDMRWGITSEAADNAQVINICLRELDRSDIFIGFFGQRYGWHGESDELLQRNFENALGRYPWLANFRHKSVTELEFLHGHLNHPGKLPATICFRDKAYDDSMRKQAEASGDKKTIFKYSAESEHSVELMNDLIRRVKETKSQCLGVLINYKDPHEGAKFMFESVWECCKEFLAGSEGEELSPLQRDRLCHDAYISSRTTLYLGGDHYMDELHPTKLEEKPLVLVRGPAGCGKSALLTNLVKKWSADENLKIIYHFVGCAQGTTDPKSIMQRLLEELRNINGTLKETGKDGDSDNDVYQSSNEDFHDIYVNVQNELDCASSNQMKVILIIDGLDKVTASTKTAKHLYWLPESFPSGISLLVSTQDSDTETFELLVKQRGFHDLEIRPLEQDVQKEISKETLLVNGKELSPEQLQRVVEAEQTQNPLFLKIVLSEISIYGYFRLLDKKIDSLIYSHGVKDLLSKVLQRLEEDYNVKDYHGPLVQNVLSALAVSHEGLSETELLDIFSIESQVWSPFYFALESFLISHAGLLRFAFSELQQAVEERYLQSPQQRNEVKQQLIKYFDKIRRNNKKADDLSSMKIKRVASELPWLQKDTDDKKGLIKTLSDIRIFYALQKKSVYELIDLWLFTNCKQDEICDALFHSLDVAISEIYCHQQKNGVKDMKPPGYILLNVLRSFREMFSIARSHRAQVRVLQRCVQILEGIEGKIDELERIRLLRENRYHLACAHVDNSEYEKAEALHTSVMKECRNFLQSTDDAHTKQTLAFTCNGIGVLHLFQKHYTEAEPLFQESVRLHKELGNKLSVAEATMNLGVIKLDNGEPQVALDYFTEAKKAFETIYFGHMPVLAGNLLTNMALCYRRMDDIEKAESMYLESLKVKANAVGWHNEVIATCYMNLGSLEFYGRKNYAKAEDYTRKAIEILEMNEVKLEQNEMWQAQENLVLMLISQNKWAEALPIFRRVFAMLQRENKVSQGAGSVHREMIRYLISLKEYEEAANIAVCHINSERFKVPNVYILLDHCDHQLTLSGKEPERPEELKVTYALEKIWPGNNELTGYVVQNYVLPAEDTDKFVQMIKTMDEMNPTFEWSAYDAGAVWCENLKTPETAALILKEGLNKYPNAQDLKTKLFDVLFNLKNYEEGYQLLKQLLKEKLDNQALMLLGGFVAMCCDDLDLCLELWEKAAEMPDEGLAEKAKSRLTQLKADLAKSKNEASATENKDSTASEETGNDDSVTEKEEETESKGHEGENSEAEKEENTQNKESKEDTPASKLDENKEVKTSETENNMTHSEDNAAVKIPED